MSVPSEAELRRFFADEAVAREAHRVAVVTSWLSLRLLDHLYREGPASTGDLARSLNMDMREVRDRLDELSEIGVVAEQDGTWEATADGMTAAIGRDDGVTVSLTVGETAERVEAATDAGDAAGSRTADGGADRSAPADEGVTDEDEAAEEDSRGLLAGLVRRLGRLFRP